MGSATGAPRTAGRSRSMEITQQVRDCAAKMHVLESEAIRIGMEEKAREFTSSGGEIYQHK